MHQQLTRHPGKTALMQDRTIRRSETKTGTTFPIKILVLGIAVSVLLFTGVGKHMWGSYRDLQAAQDRNMRLQELTGVITYLDEVLTMSARMNAATGDTTWEARYLQYEPQLDAAIQEAQDLAPSTYGSDGRGANRCGQRRARQHGASFLRAGQGWRYAGRECATCQP